MNFARQWCQSLALALLISSSMATLGQAPESATPNASVTLDALVAEVMAKNPERQFYEAEITAAKSGRKHAGVRANPEFNSTLGYKGVRGPGLSEEGIAWSASVMQPLEWPGRVGLRKAIANQDVDLAELGLRQFDVALTTRARSLAFNLFVAQEKAEAMGEVAGRFKDLREVLVQRDPTGLTPLLETRVIEATELNTQRKTGNAALAVKTALLELNQLRGLPPETPLTISQTEPNFQPAGSPAPFVQMARTNNFAVRLRAAELAQQGFRVELARNERYPGLAVGPAISEERAGGERERIIGLSVSVPLPLWNRNKGNIETAQVRQMQAEMSLATAQRELERKVVEAVLTYEAKLAEMAKWRPDSVTHFKSAAELADRHYRLGAVPAATYVELQKQYLEAVESLLETKSEALAAAVQLELLTGQKLPLLKPATEVKP